MDFTGVPAGYIVRLWLIDRTHPVARNIMMWASMARYQVDDY
jgi:hypothetical protein